MTPREQIRKTRAEFNRKAPQLIYPEYVCLSPRTKLDKNCEYREVLMAGTLEQRDEELADLEHSIQTYFDIRAKQGVDIEVVRSTVVKKNARRGYYKNIAGYAVLALEMIREERNR